jgi:Ran GTPase-activating protein (RanGAP) involved in mRNA processing and transport
MPTMDRMIVIDGHHHDADNWSRQFRLAASDPGITKLALLHLNLMQVPWQPLIEDASKKWKSLELVDCALVDNAVTSLLQLDNQRLHLSFHGRMEQGLGHILGEGLRTTRSLLQLTVESVVWTQSGMEGFSQGLTSTRTLKELDLNSSTFGDDFVLEILSQGLEHNTTLSCVRLDRCNLQDRQLATLVNGLAEHRLLEELFLGCNLFRQEGMRAIADLLEQNRLRTLGMRHCLPDEDPPLNILLDAFPLNSSLKTLHLASNNLQDEDMGPLAAALQESSITTLDLTQNRITDQGMITLASNLSPHLEKLWLLGNPIGHAGAQALLELLKTTHLELSDVRLPTNLGFSKNAAMEELQSQFQYYGRLNRGGRRLLTCNSRTVPRALWYLVLGRVNRLEWGRDDEKLVGQADVIYFLLHGPVLLER